jgi:ParB-like chromosome segregation protein Spo0J
MVSKVDTQVEQWPIEKLILYVRNPRKNDAAVDRMCASIREFGFKIPVLARSDGEVVDGHLRLKAARKLAVSEIPVILCDEWSEAQVKAFRLMVNRSVTWAAWDEELLALELQELNAADFDLDLTGFNPGEIDDLLALPDEEKANEAPPVPENPVSRTGDLWLCGKHRVQCGNATDTEDVAKLLGDRKPILMVTDPPYGIELDTEWRDRAGLNGCGPAEASYMKKRTEGHTETTISGDTRADWSEAFELVPSIQIGYIWHASVFTREVFDGLLRIGSYIRSRSFGTRIARCSRGRITGISTSPVGMSGRRTRPGLGRPARIQQSGIRQVPSSSWAAQMRKNTITRLRSPSI